MNDPDLATLMLAHTPAEATVVAALLRSANIPFYVDGRLLVDEFAMSQSLMGLKSRISVSQDDLPRAQALLDEARASGRELEQEGETDTDAEPTPRAPRRDD